MNPIDRLNAINEESIIFKVEEQIFKTVSKYSIEYRNIKGEFHNINDEPAIIENNNDKYWYKNNKLHRDNDLPAVECSNGYKSWYKNGLCHRNNNLPARIYSDGTEEYWENGERVK